MSRTEHTKQHMVKTFGLKNNLAFLPYLVFFLGSFMYFAFFAEYILFYQEKASLFVFSVDFLIEHLKQPGGLTVYIGKFLTTLYHSPVLGAFVISTIITLIILVVSKIISVTTGKKALIIPFFFGIALFYLQTNYRFQLLNNAGVLLQLSIFYLVIKFIKYLKGWLPVIIVPLLYYVTGGFAWIYSVMLISYFTLYKEKNRWIKIPALLSLTIITLYISKEFVFFQSLKNLLVSPYSELNTGDQSLLFLSVAALLSLLPLIEKVTVMIPRKLSDPGKRHIGYLLTSAFVIIIIVLTGIQRIDKKTVHYFQVEKLFYQEKYDDVIAYNNAHPSVNSLTIFLNNIALCEKGRLNDLLFSSPQSPDGKTLFLKWEMVGEILKRGGYFYYTIGMINEAHRWAYENMVIKGLSPEGLKMLIKTELINGNYTMTSKYIAVLKKTLFYRNEALYFENLLFNDSAINKDRELGEKRRIRLKIDFFSITDDPYTNVERIMATDSLNKNAFEYKMAFLLLKKDYQGIASQLPLFSELGFTRFPTHVEEAITALATLNNGPLPVSGKIQVSQNSLARWNQFLTVFQQYGTNLKAAEPALKKQFGNTFWYYMFYR